MQKFVGKRLLLAVITLFIATFAVFSLIRFIPGDVVSIMLEDYFYAKNAAELRHRLGLDQPIYLQYVKWLGGVLHGSLGESLWTNKPVVEEIGRRLPISMELASLSIFISLIIAIPIGILAAVRQDTPLDYLFRGFAIFGLSVPHFWLAVMIIVLPTIWFGWHPPLVFTPFKEDPLRNLGQFVFPAFIMGLHRAGETMRMTRAMFLEVLHQDYIRTAWAKGLRERVVLYRHAFKNAMIPVITIFGLQLPHFLGSTIIIEQVFNMPGLGRLLLSSLEKRDYPLLQGTALFFTGLVIVTNLLVDLSYAWLNPRIRYR